MLNIPSQTHFIKAWLDSSSLIMRLRDELVLISISLNLREMRFDLAIGLFGVDVAIADSLSITGLFLLFNSCRA